MILNSFMMECYTRINYLYDRFVQSYTKIIQDLKDIDLLSLLTAKLLLLLLFLSYLYQIIHLIVGVKKPKTLFSGLECLSICIIVKQVIFS
jgi:hypothetical protein